MSYIDKQIEIRQRAWEEAKALLDHAEAEGRDLSGEESEKYDRITKELEERAATISKLKSDEEREAKFAAAASGIESQVRNAAPAHNGDADLIRAIARGEVRGATFEQRDVTTASTGAPVPTSFFNEIMRHMVVAGPMLEVSNIIRTAGGENLQIPRSNAYSTSAAVAQGSAFAESDPTFQSFLTLGAYKHGFLVQVSREMVEDSGVDLLGFLAEQAGISIGVAINTALTTGTGSNAPTGIVTAAGTGVTGSTAVTGAFTADNLIDLAYSVNSAYRRMPNTGWQMRGTTIAATRKLKDTYGQYLFQPSLQAGQPDQLLGYPIWENPDVAAVGTAVKSVLFGNYRQYHVRLAGGIRFDRSDDYAFANDLITFRAAVRVDGGLAQQGGVNVFLGGAS
jgi:HK97 family phage major capsid protein